MNQDLSRRRLLQLGGGLAAGLLSATGTAVAQSPAPSGAPTAAPSIEPNTVKRRGTGRRGYDPQRVSPGFTLSTPLLGGGQVYLVDMQGDVVHTWQLPHDGRLLKNGNVLLLGAQELPDTVASQVQGGLPGTEADGRIWADYLVEMTTSGETVWTWRSWEHLDPATHPLTLPSDERAFWTHGNAVIELDDGNLLLSMRNLSTIIRINRQTDEIEWELGPPPLAGAHGVNELPNGNLLLFDNGPYRVDQLRVSPAAAPFSRVLEINPATNEIVWTYQELLGWNFFSALLSNAQRLPNENTFINEGLAGRLFEVTPDGNVVWEYVNPIFGPAAVPDKLQSNMVFRAYRYTPDQIAAARGT